MIPIEDYVGLACRIMEGEFLEAVHAAFRMACDPREIMRRFHENDIDSGRVDYPELALRMRQLSHPESELLRLDLLPQMQSHGLCLELDDMEALVVMAPDKAGCGKPEDPDCCDMTIRPCMLFIAGTGTDGIPFNPNEASDVAVRFNLVLQEALANAGFSQEQIVEMTPDVVRQAGTLDRQISAQMQAEIDQEVAEFSKTIADDLDKMFGGGDST